MTRILFLGVFTFLFLLKVQAQSGADSSFTLQECIAYALSNESTIKNALIDKEIANATVRETRAIGYPKIDASISLVDNPQLQRMFFSPTNPFFGGGGGGAPAFPGIEQSGNVLVAPNLFQLRSAGDANAQLTQLIFDGSYVVGLQAASTYRELSEKNLALIKVTTVENVTKAYYSVMIAEESVKMFDINLARMDSALAELRVYQQTGLVEDIDVKRLEVQYNNLKTDKQNMQNLLGLGKLGLKLSMGMPLDQPIALEEKINSMELAPTPIASSQFDVTQRLEYSLLKTQERLSLLDLKRYKYSRFPTVAAFAKGGFIRQDEKFLNLFQDKWYGYGMLGLSVNFPILDFTRHYKIQQSKLTASKFQNTLFGAENGFKMEESNARLNFNNNIEVMQNQKRNMELAQEVVRVSRIKYKEGVGSNLEVVNAEADLQTAQINYYRALYDAMVSKINYEKATGTLHKEQ